MKTKIIISILICLMQVMTLSAQTKVKKRDINKLTDQAEEAFYNEDYRKALSFYQKLFEMNPDGADYYNYQIALCYLYSNIDNEKAMSYIDMAKESMVETPMADFYYYNLGKSFHLNNKYDQAIESYQKALDANSEEEELRKEIETQIQLCRNALELSKNPLNVNVWNISEPVNTQFGEYRPLISADESILIFTSRREGASNDTKDIDGRNYEDIYITEKDELGYWKLPQRISESINTELHEASVGLSPDGQELILYRGNPNFGGLFVSKMVGTQWTLPQMLDENINSKKSQETSASISSDGKVIYFISTRKGSVGEKDIWRSEKTGSGDWGKAVNLGKTINTPLDEESPFIHPDGKTLYFSSKGHNTMGGYDIFRTVYENGNWSKPENLGYPVNTPGDDAHFVLTADGKNGYFTSSRTGTLGEQDIYKVGFDVSVPLILVKGVVKKEDPGDFNVSINIVNKATNELMEFVYNPNPVTGKYLMVLPPGKNYDMIIQAANYQTQVVNINIPNQDQYYELYQEIILRKVPKAGEIAQEITVTNYFENIREATKKTDSPVAEIGKVASSDYIQEEMKKLIAISGKQGKNSDSTKAEIEKLTALTDKVSDNFDKIMEARMPTEVLTSSYSKKEEKSLEPVKVGSETILAVPSTAVTAIDVELAIESREKASQVGELAQLTSDLEKAKGVPKTGNYILDLANERYIENLEEEIAAIEGGYAVAVKEKKDVYAVAVKKETGLYGTYTTAMVDKEKELAEREAAVAQKETEQNELSKLREDLETAKSAKPTGNYITDLANQRYIENLEEEIAAITGGYSPKYKKKEGFAEVRKQTGLYGTQTATAEQAGTTTDAIAAKEKELADREKVIEKKEAELNAREKELYARESAIALKESAAAKNNMSENAAVKPEATLKSVNEKIIYFDYNKSEVSAHYHADLDAIFSALSGNADYKVEIAAHTDSKGTNEYNLALSKRRADSVKRYLVSKGVKTNRIALKFFGESQPLAPNANPDGSDNPGGRDKNRRAEIRVKG